jgi:hypothetical protein
MNYKTMSYYLGIYRSGSGLFQGTYFGGTDANHYRKSPIWDKWPLYKQIRFTHILHWSRESDYGWMFILNNIIMQHFIQSEVKTLQ